MMGKDKFLKVLEISRQKIRSGKGKALVPKSLVGEMIISYQSLFDTINPDGDYNIFPYNEYLNKLKLSKKELFKEFKQISKPALVIYGECDEYCFGAKNAINILKKESNNKNNFEYKIIPGADHGFTGKEKELARLIASWL